MKRGRPKGTGGPPEKVRRNRVVLMLTDAEFAKLSSLAEKSGKPLGTEGHALFASALKQRRVRKGGDSVTANQSARNGR